MASEHGATVPVTQIQRFSTHDGPGVRTTVFFKGCPLRCRWCHNPETQSAAMQLYYISRFCIGCEACAAVCPASAHEFAKGQHHFHAERCLACLRCVQVCPSAACEASARQMRVEEILAEVMRDRAFFGREGGLTLSGGEPLFHPEAALHLLSLARAQGLHTALETCGYFEEKWLEPLSRQVNLFLWDFKDSDPARHREYTGVSNEKILKNLRILDSLGGNIRLRCILVQGVNLSQAHLEAIASLYHSLAHCSGVDLLPYHPYGASKAAQLGRNDPGRTDWVPDPETMRDAVAFLKKRMVSVRV